jgi:hypothetical protein
MTTVQTAERTFDVVGENLSREEGRDAIFRVDAESPHRDTGYSSGDILNYEITGVTEDDIDVPLSGTVTLSDDLTGYIRIPIRIDQIEEGVEILSIRVFDEYAEGSNSMEIRDGTWTPFNHWIVGENLSRSEGELMEFRLEARNYPAGSIFNYVISGVDASDIDVAMQGSVAIDASGVGRIEIPIVLDESVEEDEELTITIEANYKIASQSQTIVDVQPESDDEPSVLSDPPTFLPETAGYYAALLIGASFGNAYLSEYFGIARFLCAVSDDLAQVTDLVIESGLIEQQIGSSDDTAWIRHVYQNCTGVEPDSLSLAVFTQLLDSGETSRSELLGLAMQVPSLETQIDLVGLQENGLEYVPFFA